MTFSTYSNFKRPLTLGFSLVELLVSLGIMVGILAVIVSNQTQYTDSAALGVLANNISASLSEAQAYGLGTKEFSPGSDNFDVGYGLEFSLLNPPNGSNNAYISFADRNDPVTGLKNQTYDSLWSCPVGGASECLSKTAIANGDYVTDLCVVKTVGNDSCSLGRVDISFVRPNAEAQLAFFNNGGNPYNPSNIKGARIKLSSPKGLTKSVIIYTTGQISVQ